MKYIRTKDGIYKTRQCYPEETLFENVTYVYRHEFVKNKDIIKQANTIEELCDNGVIIDLNGKHTITYYLKEKKCWLMGERKYISVFYGAIWTDKGLQFVARMNNEGVLELL